MIMIVEQSSQARWPLARILIFSVFRFLQTDQSNQGYASHTELTLASRNSVCMFYAPTIDSWTNSCASTRRQGAF